MAFTRTFPNQNNITLIPDLHDWPLNTIWWHRSWSTWIQFIKQFLEINADSLSLHSVFIWMIFVWAKFVCGRWVESDASLTADRHYKVLSLKCLCKFQTPFTCWKRKMPLENVFPPINKRCGRDQLQRFSLGSSTETHSVTFINLRYE